MIVSLHEGISIEVSLCRTIKCKLSERHLKLNAQTARSWLQQDARLLTRTTCRLIAARYPPCVTIEFPWHTSTDAASSSSCRETIDP